MTMDARMTATSTTGDLPGDHRAAFPVGFKINLLAQPKAKYFAKIWCPAATTRRLLLGGRRLFR